MTKANFAKALVEKNPDLFQNKAQAEKAAAAVIEGIKDLLISGDGISFQGFGSFKVVDKPERTARNPQSGDSILIPAHKAPVMKFAAAMKDAVK